jgi:hypothetical protein
MPLCQLLISDSDTKLLLASILPESYRTAECPSTIHASKEDSLSQNHETKIKKGQPSVERFKNEGGCQWQAVVENKNQTMQTFKCTLESFGHRMLAGAPRCGNGNWFDSLSTPKAPRKPI